MKKVQLSNRELLSLGLLFLDVLFIDWEEDDLVFEGLGLDDRSLDCVLFDSVGLKAASSALLLIGSPLGTPGLPPGEYLPLLEGLFLSSKSSEEILGFL